MDTFGAIILPNTICILKKKYIKIITTHAIDFSSSCIWAYFKFYVTYMFIFIMKRVVLFFIFIFGCTSLRCCAQAFSSCGEQGLLFSCCVQAYHDSGFFCCKAQAPGCAGSVAAGCRLSCPEACGVFPEQGSKLCPLHWKVDS